MRISESVCIGPPASLQSYLSVPSILSAASSTGSAAVHPGYGFLSENAEFSSAVRSAGLAFVGPSADAMRSLGDKIASKRIAREANVNTIPGYDGVVADAETAVRIANEEIGYPVMIKASAGGGGKGMRIARDDDELREGFSLSREESAKFFDDDRLLVERYVAEPHHIEIQVLAGKNPATGELEVLCFPERECSIQRRNQKILEESPSAFLRPEVRNEMVRQCRSLVQAVGYESAGTVEFLVDGEQNFYFLEMNTRLQVEHPVTEEITGVDLVEGMIRVAAGMGVPPDLLKLAEENDGVVPFTGHAVEARIYAEDPFRDFLPSTGTLCRYKEPTTTGQVKIRVDSGVEEGHVISPHYDPMISKLVAYSKDGREQAIKGLSFALDRYFIDGVRHNIPFLASVCRNDRFLEGVTPTSFIAEQYPHGFSGVQLEEREKETLVAVMVQLDESRRESLGLPPLPLEENKQEIKIVLLDGMFGDQVYEVDRTDDGNTFIITKMGECLEPTKVCIQSMDYSPSNPIVEVCADGQISAIQILHDDHQGTTTVQTYGATVPVLVTTPAEYALIKHMHPPPIVDTSDSVLSFMPGMLISYSVEEGDSVVDGQDLCIVEAMKMQNVLKSTRTGVIKTLKGIVGENVRESEVVIEYE